MGIFQDVARTLGGGTKPSPNAFDEVLSYLNSFKILLILDNLETILDKNVIDFFSKLNGSSKILVTSRVGTGEMNFRFPLGPLSSGESVRLLRTTAKARRVDDLNKINVRELTAYCKRMKYNAGFIKWFVSAVQSGKRPEEVLVDPKIFLDFCLSNVYDHLSDDSKKLAGVMLSLAGKHSQSVLSFISEIGGDDFKQALQQLWSANLVTMSTSATDQGSQTVYELAELPRLFIIKNHPTSRIQVNEYQSRKRKIGEIYKTTFERGGINKYYFKNIGIRSADDTVVAKYLMDAISAAGTSYEAALKVIDKAKALDPAFYEVHRVEAIIHRNGGNFPAAFESYETAISCEPSSPTLRFWYAGFLMRDADDIEGALEQFRAALELDPGAPQIVVECSRCLMFARNYSEANETLTPLLGDQSLPLRLRKMIQHLDIQIVERQLEGIERETPIESKLDILEQGAFRVTSILDGILDEPIAETARNIISVGSTLLEGIKDFDGLDRFLVCRSLYRDLRMLDVVPIDAGVSSREVESGASFSQKAGSTFTGNIVRFNYQKGYGFIEVDQLGVIFFHKSDFEASANEIAVGLRVSFVVGIQADKVRAVSILPLPLEEDTPAQQREHAGDPLVGVVKVAIQDKSYGFIYTDDGTELFFHRNHLLNREEFRQLVPGDRVKYVVGRNAQGPCADRLEKID